MNSEIFSLLHRLGITPNYAGYFQTAQAVELCVEDPERLTLVTKLVYAEVGKRYGASWKTVERNIRTVSIIAWERSLPALDGLHPRLAPAHLAVSRRPHRAGSVRSVVADRPAKPQPPAGQRRAAPILQLKAYRISIAKQLLDVFLTRVL